MKPYYNKNLREAFDLYVREQDALLPDEEELSAITLSPAYHEKMKRLLTLRKRGFYVFFGTVGRRVASILIAVVLALTTATVSVKALREPALRFFTEVFDKFTRITFVDDTPDSEQPAEDTFEPRTPSYIPAGYVVEQETDMEIAHHIIYADANGNKIRYAQRRKAGAVMQIDTEGTTYEEITINDCVGIAYSNKGFNYIIFSDERYIYTLSGVVSTEKLKKVAESIPKN